jgi:voltage-gated potassium channel Kch
MKSYKIKKSTHNIILFLLNITYIIIIGLFVGEKNQQKVYYLFISLIYLYSAITVKKKNILFYAFPIILTIMLWVGLIFDMVQLAKITGLISTIYFILVIYYLVTQIARSKKVRLLEFLEAVNIYLLMGIAASILFKAIYTFDHATFSTSVNEFTGRADFIYFSFVTLTTLGYGDILPISPLARSITILISITGQLYLTMIIALLVGKYLSNDN